MEQEFIEWFLRSHSFLKVTKYDVTIIDYLDDLVLAKLYGYRYYVFRRNKSGNFIVAFDAGRDADKANSEFVRHVDSTIFLPLKDKIELIDNEIVKKYVRGRVRQLEFSLHGFDKFTSIQANRRLNFLGSRTLKELIHIAAEEIVQLKQEKTEKELNQ